MQKKEKVNRKSARSADFSILTAYLFSTLSSRILMRWNERFILGHPHHIATASASESTTKLRFLFHRGGGGMKRKAWRRRPQQRNIIIGIADAGNRLERQLRLQDSMPFPLEQPRGATSIHSSFWNAAARETAR